MKGYRTILIAILTMLGGATGAVPGEYQNEALVLSGVAMALLRYFTDSPIGKADGLGAVALVGILGLGSLGLTGCTQMLGKLGLQATDCALYDVASARYVAKYDALCAQAPDPTDDNCLKADGIAAASALCRAAVAAGDAEKNAAAVEKFEDAGVPPPTVPSS